MAEYFLGANSKDGFYSLYREFPPDRDAFLHILKGGPGTGKSSLLRKLAAAAEEKGWEVHRVLCSGDPGSLDGVYIPALHMAWVDGTAPHAIEPRLFGVTGDYWDLTPYFAEPFGPEEKIELMSLQQEYKTLYDKAYALLAVSAGAEDEAQTTLDESEPMKIIASLPRCEREGKLQKRFLSAISCEGLLRLSREWEGCTVLPAKPEQLPACALEARRRGWNSILALSPLSPSEAELLLLPEAGLAFQAERRPGEEKRRLLLQAVEVLKEAKTLHDEMEAVYRPHMDFAALTSYTDKQIAQIFQD